MTTRLVAFLGLGPKKEAPHYEEVSYRFGERAAAKTPLMMSALCELFGPVDGVLVLGTREVREHWVDTGLLAEKLSVRWDFREVAAGRTQEECWKLFDAVREALVPRRSEFAGLAWEVRALPGRATKTGCGPSRSPDAAGRRASHDQPRRFTATRY